MAFRSSGRGGEAPDRRTAFWGLSRAELIVFVLYVAMLCFELVFYRQSEDEGRAWLLARSFGVFRLVFHILRFEGHPALYYLLLWGPAHLGIPFIWINRVAIAVASAAVFFLLRYAPFPFAVRALLPFGFALGYQYAVNFRGYTLIPLLAFLAAHEYRQNSARPLRMAILLALLANVSIHGTMVAGGFAVAYGAKLAREARLQRLSSGQTRRAMAGLTVFAASVVMVAVCVWPAKYLNLPLGDMLPRLLHRMGGPEIHAQRETRGPAIADLGRPHPAWHPASFQMAAASLHAPDLSAEDSTLPAVDHAAEVRRLTFVYPVARWAPLAIGFEMLVVFFLFRRREPWLLLPFALLTYFLVFVYVQLWHTGLVWVTLIAILWAAWDNAAPFRLRSVQGAVALVLATIGLLQIPWTVGALRYIATHATHPANATAAYLQSLPGSTRIDGNEIAFTVLPYFRTYIFVDPKDRFAKPQASPVPLTLDEFFAERADAILLREAEGSPIYAARMDAAGYSKVHRFCGAPYFPNVPVVPICIAAYQKDPTLHALSRQALPRPGQPVPTDIRTRAIVPCRPSSCRAS